MGTKVAARSGLLRGARAVLPWVIATLAATLLRQELTPVPPPDTAVTPPPVTQPEKKEEVVYEPWEQVST
jgi:hypothetical protein